jgi:flagellar basal-body rod modification protein FlgD
MSSAIDSAAGAAAAAAVAATNNAAPSSSSSSQSNANTTLSALNTTAQQFLKMLITELKNQDPTQPVDPTAFVGQIATLNQVQQQVATNDALQQLVSLFTANQSNSMVNYIGKEVTASGNDFSVTNGSGAVNYTLAAGASSAKVTITNSAGMTVFTGTGTTIAGDNSVIWNGKNNAGDQMPDGAYKFTVTATDATGKAVTATTQTIGVVTAVNTENGTSTLAIGNISVPIANVQSVSNPGSGA